MQLRTLLNMVPIDTKHVLTMDYTGNDNYDLLSPLEIMNGNSIFDYRTKCQFT